jgi:nitrogen regulatory protein P-II 1
VLTDVALITCIVQKGLADPMVVAAREAGAGCHGLLRARKRRARAPQYPGHRRGGREGSHQHRGTQDQVDRVFEKMYLAGHLDTPGMGYIYVTPLEKAATYISREVEDRLLGRG